MIFLLLLLTFTLLIFVIVLLFLVRKTKDKFITTSQPLLVDFHNDYYVNIFILCYNESVLLPHTVNHYKKQFPGCRIVIYDNESTDNSREIALSMGCTVVSWNSNNQINDYLYLDIKNNSWKKINKGWIIMVDMDEWLCATIHDLYREEKAGTSILCVEGYDMIGESQSKTLDDIDLHAIVKSIRFKDEDKNVCFLRNDITEINYSPGAHKCSPQGRVKYSNDCYIMKHMSSLGVEFLKHKMISRYKRSSSMRKDGLAIHYTDDVKKIHDKYYSELKMAKQLPFRKNKNLKNK